MYGGDRSRKTNLVEHGFRLPSALDNRPLKFEEFEKIVNQTIYVSATPADYELIKSNGVITEISAQKVEKVVDTTGAGDLFAAGFLYGYSKNKSMEECGNYASIAAAEIISHYGARPLVKLSSLI